MQVENLLVSVYPSVTLFVSIHHQQTLLQQANPDIIDIEGPSSLTRQHSVRPRASA
jgi:hypothetical protein